MAEVQKAGRVDVVVDATAQDVWQVVGDVTRTGEWSHECRDVRWLDGAVAAAPGVRFRGRNHAGWARWGRTCEILTVEEPHELTWQTVSTPLYPDSTVWRIRLEPAGDRTRIVQEFEVVRAPKLLDHLYAAVIPAHRDRTARLTADLERIGRVAAQAADPAIATAVPQTDSHLKRRLTRIGNHFGVWLYRRFDGRFASSRKGATVLLLTVPGRRTGSPRSTCVRYLTVDGGWIVWGTGSGSRRDPDWFQNLRAADSATVQINGRVLAARPRELVGAERERMWRQVILSRAPEVARYARKAARPIPVASLSPI